MDSAGLRWYRTGTVNITQGSTNITGVGTNWRTAGIQPGDVFMVGNSVLYEIAQVADNVNIVLNSAFQGATGTGQNYSIIRNFAGTMQAQIAAEVSSLVNKYESYIDTELQQIVGPAGPTSFPYRGTWATGREYNALDVVEYSRLLYMAVAGHVSTSENAPDATNTEWMPLQIAAYDDSEIRSDIAQAVRVEGFSGTRYGRLQPLGEKGFQIVEYDPQVQNGVLAFFHCDVDNKILALGHRDAGGENVTDGIFRPYEATGVLPLAIEGSGYFLYTKRNGVVYFNYEENNFAFSTSVTLGTLPIGYRPVIQVNFPVMVNRGGMFDILRMYITGGGEIILEAISPPVSAGQYLLASGSFTV